ncbi:MAG: carboxypeptidase regulatory-like domain-containing protein [Blastocatellia bacterium]
MRNKYKRTLVSMISLALLMMSLAPLSLAAQEPTGGIEGTVTDPQGAVVQNATVVIRNTATNASRTVNAGDDGHYKVSSLVPGSYEVKISAQGFKSQVATAVTVEVGRTTPLDVRLEIGGSSETVTVTGGGEAQIDRTDNTVSGVVGTVQIQNLPLNGRNFLDLARLQPGAETVDGGSFDPTKANYTGVSIGGQAGRSTQITVDGGSVVDNVVGTTVQNFSQEIVQEFQVGLSNFDLSTGASAAGSVNIVSKGGSNQYHGNGYLYWRDARFAAYPALDRLDAAHGLPPELQRSRIPFDREQFGGTFGGPLKKDKMFFFTNVEYNNQDDISIHNQTPGLVGFNGFTGKPFNGLLATGRLDYKWSDKTSLFARYSHDNNDQQAPFAPGTGILPRDSASGIFQTNDQVDLNRSDGGVLGITTSLTATMVNDFRYSVNDFHNRIDPASPGIPELRVINPDQNWKSGANYITPQVTDQRRNQIRDDLTWSKGKHSIRFGGDWERTTIDGQFAFAKPARVRLYGPNFNAFGSGPSVLQSEADFLNTPVFDISLGVGDDLLPFNTPEGVTLNNRFQFYGTDAWKLTRNFTLNYGLAYRYDTNLWNHDQGHPAIIAPLFGKGTSPSPKDTNNIAPRLGFAWDINGSGRTVIRGGFGMYYDTTIDNLRLFERADLGPPGAELFLTGVAIKSALLPGGDGRFSDNPASASFVRLGTLLPKLAAARADVESRAFNCSLPTSIECFHAVSGPLFSTEFQIPYSLQYAIGIQKQLPGKMVLQADFNYRKGVHEVLTYDANFISAVTKGGDPSPTIPSIDFAVPYADSSAFSVYKALLVRLDRRFDQGFQMTASYTLSRLRNFGGDALGLGQTISNRDDFSAEYGPGGLDRTHRLVVSAVWEMPYFKDSSSAFKKHALGGWTVSVISTALSGLPFSALLPDSVDLFGSGSFFSYLPGTRPGEIGRDINSLSKLNEIIGNYNSNRNKFAARIVGGVPVDPQGTELRELALLPEGTQLGGDSVISQDLRLTKVFRMSENVRFDLIGEVFNLFNVANLTNTATNVIPAKDDITGPADFITYKPTQRTTNIFGTGGTRAFQFALKFTF